MASVNELKALAKLVRYNIITSTTEAGSGHPTSSLSAVELITTLFFGGYFKQDIRNPHALQNDKFILSKGHASPLLYSLYAVAGALTRDDLMTLRKFNSKLEGHPTPEFPYADVATGSLGQGLSVGLGMALGIRLRINKSMNSRMPRVFVLLGDSEMAEGQNWEAMALAGHYLSSNLIGILDVNRLGQRGETMVGWDVHTYAKRAESFGWDTYVVKDGHNIEEIQNALKIITAHQHASNRPKLLIAHTIKGKGVSFLENQDGWHGKPVPKERLQEALNELGDVDLNLRGTLENAQRELGGEVQGSTNRMGGGSERDPDSAQLQGFATSTGGNETSDRTHSEPSHKEYATREAYGDALVSLGQTDPNLVVLDAEVSNSTYVDKFKKEFPDRYFEMYIAEQNMVSVALGLSKIGFKPYVSTFAAFLTRAYDQIRMSQYSYGNIKFCGSHAGVSIGQDGASQMGLEDLSMFQSLLESTVVYPSDRISTVKLMQELHNQQGIGYIRTTRAKTPSLYNENEKFPIGGSKILRHSERDKAAIITAGITLHEALKAYEQLKKDAIDIAVIDMYSIKPIDNSTIQQFSHLPIIVVEDHYPHGGLASAILSSIENWKLKIENFSHLCVHKIPHSGSPEKLLTYEEIDAAAIVNAVKNLIS